jgi:hypothetical protein
MSVIGDYILLRARINACHAGDQGVNADTPLFYVGDIIGEALTIGVEILPRIGR